MQIEFSHGNVKCGLHFSHWKRAFTARRATSWVLAFGPFYFVRRGLPFSKDAARKEFDRMNAPGSPLRALADWKRFRG